MIKSELAKLFHDTAGRGIAEIREDSARKKLSKLSPGEHFCDLKPSYISQLANAKESHISEFYGKIEDEKAAERFGARDLDEFSYWAWRSCGLVGVEMILRSEGLIKPRKTTMDLINEGLKLGGYDTRTDVGWYHRSLIELAQGYGLEAKAKKFVPPSEIALLISKGATVLASIYSKTGGHFLLLYGFSLDEQSRLKGFWTHDPNNYKETGQDKFVSISDFTTMSTRRIISVKNARN